MVPYYRTDKHLLFPLSRKSKWASSFASWALKDRGREDHKDKAIMSILSDWLSSRQEESSNWPAPDTFRIHGPSKNIPIIRARTFSESDPEASIRIRKALRSPTKWMGAPPAKLAKYGRCHFPNKPVFYGSYQDLTSMAEISPVVSDKIVLADFLPTRDLNIFRLCSVGDLFDLRIANYVEWLATAKKSGFYDWVSFQYHLDLWIGFPLKGFKYDDRQYQMRRQVVRCLRRILAIDGIEFNSSQVAGTNLVIFPEDAPHAKFPLKYVAGSAEVYRVVDRSVYAEKFGSRRA